MAVFARLPLDGAAACLCYGAQIDEDPIAAGGVMVRRAGARDGDNILFTGDDYVLSKPARLKMTPFGGATLLLKTRFRRRKMTGPIAKDGVLDMPAYVGGKEAVDGIADLSNSLPMKTRSGPARKCWPRLKIWATALS